MGIKCLASIFLEWDYRIQMALVEKGEVNFTLKKNRRHIPKINYLYPFCFTSKTLVTNWLIAGQIWKYLTHFFSGKIEWWKRSIKCKKLMNQICGQIWVESCRSFECFFFFSYLGAHPYALLMFLKIKEKLVQTSVHRNGINTGVKTRVGESALELWLTRTVGLSRHVDHVTHSGKELSSVTLRRGPIPLS